MGENSRPDAEPRIGSDQTAAAVVKHWPVSVSRGRHNDQHRFLPAFEPLRAYSWRFVTIHHRCRRMGTVRFYSRPRTIRPPLFTPLRRSDGTLALGWLH